MNQLNFKTLVENRTFLKNLIIALKYIILTNKSAEIERIIKKYRLHLRNLIFSASNNDNIINRSILNTRAFSDYSITPGYPGSFLSLVINTIRENQFIIRNNLDLITTKEELIYRYEELKGILKKIIAVDKQIDDKEKKKEAEAKIWNGSYNAEYSNQTIDFIFKNSTLKGIFSDILSDIKDQVQKTFKETIEVTDNDISPGDVDKDIESAQINNIIKLLNTAETKFIQARISSKVSEKRIKSKWDLVKEDFNSQSCKIQTHMSVNSNGLRNIKVKYPYSDIKNKCRNSSYSIINLDTGGKLNNIGNMDGITIKNKNMTHVLEGMLGIKDYNIIVQKDGGICGKIKLNLVDTFNLNEDVVKMELCHSVILLNTKAKKMKFYARCDKCCVDNIFKIIGYNSWLNNKL